MLALMWSVMWPVVSLAQSSRAIIDSAAQARRAFRDATQAATPAEALPLLLRAAHAWPTQPAYWTAVARTAARAGDAQSVVTAMNTLAALQSGRSLLADTSFTRFVQAARLDRTVAKFTRSTAPRRASRVAATLTDTTIFAEGVDADPSSDLLYVASVRQRTILEVRRDGRVRDLQLARHPRIGAMLGVRVARDGKTLYATTAGIPQMHGYVASDSTIAAILRVRIADGDIIARWDVPPDGTRHLLGDLAIGDDGTVYASDSYAPVLYRLRPGGVTLEAIRDPLFRSLQGIAPVPGNDRLIVADYSHGLLRVDLTSLTVVRVGDAQSTTSLGIDGILWYDGAIIAVQNGIDPPRLARFVLDSAQTHVVRVDVLDRPFGVADQPTIATRWRGGVVYVANSQWEQYEEDGTRKRGTAIQPTILLYVPLPRAR